ncbi:MAG: discoidin domain-containing protein, partial [Verrucomicrobiota bacterium]
MAKFIQPSFAAGELSPSLAGRVDLAKYRVGLKTCKNFFVQPHGGVSNRPGTQYIAEAAGKGRLIPFRFNVVQTYVLEFTDFKMRVIKDGGLVQFGANTAVYGTDISDGSPTISPSLAFDGDEVTYWRTDHLGHDGIGLAYVGQDFTTAKTIGAIALLQGAGVPNVYSYNLLDAASSVLVQYSSNGSTWSTAATLDTSTVSNAASTEYSFTPVSARYWRIVQNSNVFSNYTGGAESYWKVRDLVFFQAGDLEVTSPYAEADLPLVKFVQSADTLFLTHPSYPPYKLTRTSHSSWEFTPMTFTVSSHTPLGLAAAYTNGDSSPVTVRTIKYQVSAIDSNGEESLPCAAVLVTDVDNPWFSGATVDISWTAVDGATGYNVYKNVRGYYGLIGTVRKDAARITTGSMISGGAGGGSTAAEAGDGLTLTHWVSSQVYTSVSGAAYIGRDLGSAKTVRAFRIMQGTRINNSYRNGLGSVATVTLQSSTNGSTWTTRQTVTLQTAPHIWQTIAVTGGISARYWRLLAGSQPTGTGTAQGWRVYELEFYEDGLGTNFTDDNIDPNPAFAPAEERNPFAGEGNQPGAVAIFEQRLVFARTDNAPQTIWTSRTGLFENMGQSAVALADDAIEVTIDSKQVNEIRHLVPFDELVVFTSGSEWIVSHGQNSDSLTPSSVSARIQGYRGCSDLSPLVIGRAMLFMQRNGGAVRELEFSLQVNGLNSTNISVLAQHLFKNHTLVEWAYQQEPDSIVWAVRDDGVLLGFSYLKEHEVWAWHQHVTDGEFESVCCIEGDGQDDLYMIVKRT